jgi:oxygen-dependent protoporphyrinogen oxidase
MRSGPGDRFILTEGRERVGGNITSLSSPDGYRWEEGPNSFQPNDSMLKAAVSPPPPEQSTPYNSLSC